MQTSKKARNGIPQRLPWDPSRKIDLLVPLPRPRQRLVFQVESSLVHLRPIVATVRIESVARTYPKVPVSFGPGPTLSFRFPIVHPPPIVDPPLPPWVIGSIGFLSLFQASPSERGKRKDPSSFPWRKESHCPCRRGRKDTILPSNDPPSNSMENEGDAMFPILLFRDGSQGISHFEKEE